MDQLEQLERLNRLRESGALTDAEYDEQKGKLLSAIAPRSGDPKWIWIGASIVLALVAIFLAVTSQYGDPAPAPVLANAHAPARTTNEIAAVPPPAPPPCVAPTCRVLTPEGWGGVRVGTRVETAMRAAGLRLRHPGHYDQAFADEPERLVQCNIYGIIGAPENLSVFVENHVITSIGASLASLAENGGETFQTDRGVRLGDPESAVRRAYPHLHQEPDIYSRPPDKMLFFRGPHERGIKFSISHGRVAAIDVGGHSIGYVEGCL